MHNYDGIVTLPIPFIAPVNSYAHALLMCTVQLPNLANWYAFLKQILPTCKVMIETIGPMESTK